MRPCVAENYGFIRYELPFINALAVEVPDEKAENLKRHHLVAMVAKDGKVSKLPCGAEDLHFGISGSDDLQAGISGSDGLQLGDPGTRNSGTRRATRKSAARSSELALAISETRGFGTTIAIIDTGVAPHYDLVKPHNRIVAFKDFINHRTEPYDDDGHGTHVAGIAAGNAYIMGGEHGRPRSASFRRRISQRRTGAVPFDSVDSERADGALRFGRFAGSAPMANIAALKALDEHGSGATSDILAAMQWVVDNKERYNIRVVNLSLGINVYDEREIDPLAIAVTALTALGIVVVTAAGNSGPGRCTITSPGTAPAAITVGACHNGEIARFSSRGPTLHGAQKPDLVAPGVGIVSLDAATGKAYIAESGTSMACPRVSGVVACILAGDPTLSPPQVRSILYKMLIPLPGAPRAAQGRGALLL